MEVSLKCVKPEKDGCCSNSPGNQHSLSGGREDGHGVPHSHLIYQLRPSAVYLLFWFSNVGYFLFPKSCFVFPRLFFVFPKSCYIFPKSCHYGWLFLIRHLTEYFLSPSGDLGIGLVWDNNPTPPDRSFLVRLLKSSSNWTKLSMMGPQLFSEWYQMILDVFWCFPLGCDFYG